MCQSKKTKRSVALSISVKVAYNKIRIFLILPLKILNPEGVPPNFCGVLTSLVAMTEQTTVRRTVTAAGERRNAAPITAVDDA